MATVTEALRSVIDILNRLSPEERAAVADEVDRVTWRDRMHCVAERIQARNQADPISDEEIDRIVDEVRSEMPLYERYWTRRRSSAP